MNEYSEHKIHSAGGAHSADAGDVEQQLRATLRPVAPTSLQHRILARTVMSAPETPATVYEGAAYAETTHGGTATRRNTQPPMWLVTIGTGGIAFAIGMMTMYVALRFDSTVRLARNLLPATKAAEVVEPTEEITTPTTEPAVTGAATAPVTGTKQSSGNERNDPVTTEILMGTTMDPMMLADAQLDRMLEVYQRRAAIIPVSATPAMLYSPPYSPSYTSDPLRYDRSTRPGKGSIPAPGMILRAGEMEKFFDGCTI